MLPPFLLLRKLSLKEALCLGAAVFRLAELLDTQVHTGPHSTSGLKRVTEGQEAGSAWLGAQETKCTDPWGSHVLQYLMPKGGFGCT